MTGACFSCYNLGMENVKVSEKQLEFLRDNLPPHGQFHRINLLEGSVRSGKTWISLVAWAIFIATMPKNAEFLMVGKTLTTLKRNCLGLLQQLEPTFWFSVSQKKATLYGRTIWLEGASDERSENKIRGMTLTGAYVDELTLVPEGFYKMLLGRLSEPGAKLIATTNPDSPTHYIYTDIIQNNQIDKQVTKFLITENPFLDAEYVEQLANEYTGVFYQRYYLGEWVKAEGLVYPMYDNTVETVERSYSHYAVSMDYGILNPTAMILWGLYDGVWYAVKEYYHSGKESFQQKTDEEYYRELESLCFGVSATELIIDPSASSFITLVRQKGKFSVRKADNEVIEGIQHTASALRNGLIKINDCCKNTIKEFSLYSWDSKADEDTVIKENDHCLAGDTIVHTLFGRRKIKDLIGKRGWVWSYDEKRKRRVLRRFRDVRQTGSNREMVRITLNNGKTVDCTSDHLILTKRGWVEAGKLNATDCVIDIMDGMRYNYDTENRRKRRYHNDNSVF